MKISEEDWVHTLEVFRACLPRRGRKADDDRRFLEALYFFAVENVRWRALPKEFGNWNSVWKRFDRLKPEQGRGARSLLRRPGLHEPLGSPAPDVRLHHRARARFGGGRNAVGQNGQALGQSRGGFTTKIHGKSDSSGNLIAFDLTGGRVSDARHFDILLDIGPDIDPRAVIADKGYSSKANRAAARARGIAPVIPHKSNEEDKPAFFAKTLYKARARIEQGSGRSSALSESPCDAKNRPQLQINRQRRRASA